MLCDVSAADWTTPGVDEVASGVHRIPLPLPDDGLRAVNVYVLSGAAGPVLIDAGWAIAGARELLADGLRTLGFELGDISRFLITHGHRDHYTQAVALRREFGTTVSLGLGEKPFMDAVAQPGRPLELLLHRLREAGAAVIADAIAANAAPERDVSRYEPPDDWLAEGDLDLPGGRRLAVIATPGHTQGHVVFADDAAGLLFAGDHVLPTITPSISVEPLLADNPLGDYLRSLAVVRARPDALLLPAHGPVAPSVHARVDELLDHHDTRLADTGAALAAGADTAFAAAQVLLWTRRGRAFADLDPFNQSLAVSETAAHLDLLVVQERATTALHDGVRRYATA